MRIRLRASVPSLGVAVDIPSLTHGWLAAVLPAHATRFRVSDPGLAAALREAGAEMVGDAPDVQVIEGHSDIRRDAPAVVLSLSRAQPDGGHRLARAARRAARAAEVRARAEICRRVVGRRGFAHVDIVPWDVDQPVQLPGRQGQGRRLAELLPQRALVVGHRGHRSETVLEAVAKRAERALGGPIHYRWPLARAGLLVVVADTCVLRIAVGPGRDKIHAQKRLLDVLAAADPPRVVGERIPWIIDSGRIGLADWSAERRIHGDEIETQLPEELVWECMEFLVALHLATAEGPRRSLADDARRCAVFCDDSDAARRMIALGEALEAELAGLPRGFGHGDFWTRNLMCHDGHLVGVIDWDSGGPGRLPLLDLVHLQVSSHREGRHLSLGEALVGHQLPLARRGGDDVIAAYCARVGFESDPALLEALTLAFWIDRNATELQLHPDRATPVWVRRNITVVLEHLAGSARLPGST